MEKLPYGRPLSWRADSPLQRMKREQKKEYLYSNDISKILERDFTISKDLAESKLGKFVTDVLPWLDIPAGLTKTLLTKGLFAGILKKHALEHIERNVKKALKRNYLADIQSARNFYSEIKHTPQSLLDKIRHFREGVPFRDKLLRKEYPKVPASVHWEPGMKQADLTYYLRNMRNPHTAAHELGHVATMTEPGLGEKLLDQKNKLLLILGLLRGVPESYFYTVFDPAEYAARYFERHIGPTLVKRPVSEAAIRTAVKDIEARTAQFGEVISGKAIKGHPLELLRELYGRGILATSPPAFAKGRRLKKDTLTMEGLKRLLAPGSRRK